MSPDVVNYDGSALHIMDQRELPYSEKVLSLRTLKKVCEVIEKMAVRGAPLIGIVAGWGFVLWAKRNKNLSGAKWKVNACKAIERLRNTRPTAVNLHRALNRMQSLIERGIEDIKIFENEAKKIQEEEILSSEKIGESGKSVILEQCRVLTICNTGKLATGGIGTAMGVIFKARRKIKKVFICETRPFFQGARLSAYEFLKGGIPHTIILDSEAGFLMKKGEIDLVIVGADRIARNGDTANKIGTYTLSVLAKAHSIPFYVAAPLTSFDVDCERGEDIIVELRDGEEIKGWKGTRWAPEASEALYYAFDITPSSHITGFITEKGILKPPFNL